LCNALHFCNGDSAVPGPFNLIPSGALVFNLGCYFFLNISNDVGRVKGHGLLFLSFADTRFASAQTHWFLSRVTTLLLR
jgi:hypothetical protein